MFGLACLGWERGIVATSCFSTRSIAFFVFFLPTLDIYRSYFLPLLAIEDLFDKPLMAG